MSNVQSISARLLQLSKKYGISHQMLLIRFFHERLLYRLSLSSYKENLLLKGGNLLYGLQELKARPTVDIDFLGRQLTNQAEELKVIFGEILQIATDDGVCFDTQSITATVINEQNHYSGIRIRVTAMLGAIKHNVHIDIGYGDWINPNPPVIHYPVLLSEFEAPHIYAYTVETVIAEKLQAIIALAQLNSRMKDFYDIYTLIHLQTIDKTLLEEAISNTFARRNTPLDFDSVVFTESFCRDNNRVKMWNAFLKKINVAQIPFCRVVKDIKGLIEPIFLPKAKNQQ
ncbi:nucleotidyl transferase AbiEii/AbiGii toxin family protein [Capnocytophaga canis]|uniref:nucleotidyl transferase AbiEii/AbiGii toxin family protein n=1 Tax=Capnocytophaga canis TaxID=1848903 RepID=UPI001AC2F6E7|nr:nucleotidyl transferase AbiEii/AbiGii toxin family protein [Capnocytophaga canis]GIM62120.1 hypothetical protein CAPN008_21700 [Capnocytophaga canis]